MLHAQLAADAGPVPDSSQRLRHALAVFEAAAKQVRGCRTVSALPAAAACSRLSPCQRCWCRHDTAAGIAARGALPVVTRAHTGCFRWTV